MGSQLSSSSSSSSPSPGLSSLGSHGQRSARCRSPPATQSASQSSLALSSSGCSSAGRHSAALVRLPHQQLHSPPSSASSLGQSRFLISPPMLRRHHQHQQQEQHGKGGSGKGRSAALSRWGSFTRALPTLMRGNSAGHHHQQEKHGLFVAKEQQKRHLATRKFGAAVDPNNNSGFVLPHPHHTFYETNRPKSPWSDEEGAEQCEEMPGSECRYRGADFSLKASLKKSGSRLFHGILRGGYIRALLGDDDDDDEGSGSDDEQEEGIGTEECQRLRQDMLNNNNNDNNGHFPHHFAGHFPATKANSHATSRMRTSNSSFFQPNPVAKPSAISTAALRSSLRQAKRHLLERPGNGHGMAGNGLVSSMLLAMAAGQPPSRPLSCPTEEATHQHQMQMVDWNGNCSGARSTNELLLRGQRKKVIQASSSELIRALGQFICQHCRPGLLGQFEAAQLSTWLRGVDRALILQRVPGEFIFNRTTNWRVKRPSELGWQDVAFINPANLVFLFMVIRDAFAQGEAQRLSSLRELHSFVLLCLYISYSYMGNEISYPLKPFITENTNRALFWSQCVRLIKRHSDQMLRLNSSSAYFLEVFTELKAYCPEYLPNAY